MILSNKPRGLGREVVADAAEAPAIHLVEEHVERKESAVASCEDAIAAVLHVVLCRTQE